VWLLGEEEEAGHYLYEITAFKGNTKYVYGSEVASLRTSDDEIVSEGRESGSLTLANICCR